ncbi:hypothetical protein [Streptomyces sp. NRRL S-646]|nr:hypothetical protein [Streptomyces sp. NRRL S-646]
MTERSEQITGLIHTPGSPHGAPAKGSDPAGPACLGVLREQTRET